MDYVPLYYQYVCAVIQKLLHDLNFPPKLWCALNVVHKNKFGGVSELYVLKMQSQTSAERIKQLVELEGKVARNLVTWSVPITAKSMTEQGDTAGPRAEANSTKRRTPHSNSRHRKDWNKKRGLAKSNKSTQGLLQTESTREVTGKGESSVTKTSLSEREEICKYYSIKTQRQSRSLKSPSRLNLHARYWSYLFDNLHRAMDEIYRTCEVDESIVECQVYRGNNYMA